MSLSWIIPWPHGDDAAAAQKCCLLNLSRLSSMDCWSCTESHLTSVFGVSARNSWKLSGSSLWCIECETSSLLRLPDGLLFTVVRMFVYIARVCSDWIVFSTTFAFRFDSCFVFRFVSLS